MEFVVVAGLVVVGAVVVVLVARTGASSLFSSKTELLTGEVYASLPGKPGLTATDYEGSSGASATRLIFSASNGGGSIIGFVVARAKERSGNSCMRVSWRTFDDSAASPLDTGRRQGGCWRVAAVNEVGQGPWSSGLYHDPA